MCPDELPTRFKVITPYTSWALSHITARQVHSSEKSGSNLEGGETHSRCGLYLTGGWLCGYIQKNLTQRFHALKCLALCSYCLYENQTHRHLLADAHILERGSECFFEYAPLVTDIARLSHREGITFFNSRGRETRLHPGRDGHRIR